MLSEFDDARLERLRAIIAAAAGVPSRYVRLAVASGSVVLTAEVTVPTVAQPSRVEAGLTVQLGTKQGAAHPNPQPQPQPKRASRFNARPHPHPHLNPDSHHQRHPHPHPGASEHLGLEITQDPRIEQTTSSAPSDTDGIDASIGVGGSGGGGDDGGVGIALGATFAVLGTVAIGAFAFWYRKRRGTIVVRPVAEVVRRSVKKQKSLATADMAAQISHEVGAMMKAAFHYHPCHCPLHSFPPPPATFSHRSSLPTTLGRRPVGRLDD